MSILICSSARSSSEFRHFYWMIGYKDTRPDTRIKRYKDTRIQGYNDTRIQQGYKSAVMITLLSSQ